MEEKENLAEVYRKNNTFGEIILSRKGINVQGNELPNIIKDSIEIKNSGGKVIVTCSFVCDKFTLIP